ncbi:HEAT repeat domain-containing protein [Archaeoglobus sp.]
MIDIVSRLFKPNIEKLVAMWDVDGLINALNHRDYKTRKRAAEALGEMKAREAVDALIKTLKDENSEVRKAAAYALGRIGDEKAIKPLVEALKDESFDVRIEAAKALKEVGYRRAAELPNLVSDVLSISRDEAFRILENIRTGKFDFLRR